MAQVIRLLPSYRDRRHAGQVLADKLSTLPSGPMLVLAIPNGGLAVAAPIAESLHAQLDAVIVRKLQIPYNTEAGFGALTSFGKMILNEPLVRQLGLTGKDLDLVRKNTEKQIADRKRAYAGLIGHSNPSKKHTILVDDGLASGYTMLAAVESLRDLRPSAITVAVPTASAGAAEKVGAAVDRLVCPRIESGAVFAVADAYEDWYDVPDSEVIDILKHFR
ncbi:MAG: phosphoribosyltransferase [Candidatus Thorarchaeota archaeon]|nr:MAG: phosphoribosyltransferase [Candidatus Thorarchaeota archaeon]